MNKQLTSKIETDSQRESRLTTLGGEELGGVEGLSKKEKGLMDMDDSVVIAGARGV